MYYNLCYVFYLFKKIDLMGEEFMVSDLFQGDFW